MSLSVGIVGLPNVGKSTLFNALLGRQQALAANFPFATIEPNVGVVPVPDDRLEKLAAVVHTNKLVPATVEFVDIAGLVKGAASGEGLGNKFLSHIREVDLVVHCDRPRSYTNGERTFLPRRIDEIVEVTGIEASRATLNPLFEGEGPQLRWLGVRPRFAPELAAAGYREAA